MMYLVNLALTDLWKDRLALICNAALIAGILVPLLVLMAAKSGVYGHMLKDLSDDPKILKIETTGNLPISPQVLATVQSWPEVAFAVLRPRAFSDNLQVYSPVSGKTEDAVVLTTGLGDPYIGPGIDLGPGDLVMTQDIAQKLKVAVGDPVELISALANRPRQMLVPMRVVHVLPETGLRGGTVLALPQTVDLFEAFIDNYAVPQFGIVDGKSLSGRVAVYERLRVHATRLEDVADLQHRIETVLGLRTQADSQRIESTLGLGRNLTLSLNLLTVVGLAGLSAALAFGFWADVHRKKVVLATLALLGLPAPFLVAYPVIQSLATSLAGLLLSFAAYGLAKLVADHLFTGMLDGASLLILSGRQMAEVAAGIVGLVAITASFAGMRCRRFDPALVLREGN